MSMKSTPADGASLVSLIHQWFEEVWSQGSEEAVFRLLTPDAVFHTLNLHGPEAFVGFHRSMRAAFSGIRVEIEHAIASGDLLAVHCHLRARHVATGREVELVGGGFARVENGRLAETWDAWDFLGLLQQLGHVPPEAMARAMATA